MGTGPAGAMERKASDAEAPEDAAAAETAPSPTFGAARRLGESFAIAVATSTGLYLIGSVYTEAYYGGMSIEVTALDLSPPFIALQSTHVGLSLLEYPLALFLFYGLYRLLWSRLEWARAWYDRVHQRFGRLVLLIVNLALVFPLVMSAIQVFLDPTTSGAAWILSDVAELMGILGIMLLLYLIWISLGPRRLLLTELREHKLIPIALLAALYLLDALIATANDAALDAELLMTGQSDASMAITVALANGVTADLPPDLILVTARNGNYFLIEQQEVPPSPRPIAYVLPFRAVDVAYTRRVNDADLEIEDWMIEAWDLDDPASPTAP